MGRDEDYFYDIDWLDDGSTDPAAGTSPPRQPWPRWFTAVVVAVAGLAAVVAVLNHARRAPTGAPAAAAPTTRAATKAASTRPASPTTGPATTRGSSASPPTPASITITVLDHPLLDTTAGWELFGRGSEVLVRIQPAAGKIISTPVPSLLSSGPAYLLAGPHQVTIRPLDNVPGYLVRDGQPATELTPLLNENGPVFPGPAPGQMWTRAADDHQPTMVLATLDGKRLADFIEIPDGVSSFDAVADGAGYLLYSGIGGVYDARPQHLRRISTGVLLASGPTGWLVGECDQQYRCQTVLIDRTDGSRRTVAEGPVNRDSRGVISPDGSTAAMLTFGPNGTVKLTLIDLASHRQRLFDLEITEQTMDGAIVFSPDSDWLFAVLVDGTVAAINTRTGSVRMLDDAMLPQLSQLAVRPASDS